MLLNLMFYHSSVLLRKNRAPLSAGFSMVELLVSIGIVVLVLSIVVTRQQSFNGSVLLRGQAYEIALAMREVQLGAISSVSDGGGEFRSVQGVYFNESDNQQYRQFRDADGNQFRNSDNSEDFGFSGIIDSRFEIRSIEPSTIGTDLSIVFERPNFDAVFVSDASGTIEDEQFVLITIGLQGGSGAVCGQDIRQIEVRSTGQIAVVECP
jgi:type II secretory pathway pseudopilin PulG